MIHINRALLRYILSHCEVPLDRMNLADDHNLRWLQRNLGISNQGEKVDLALGLIAQILSGYE